MRLNSFTIGEFTAYANQHVSNGGASIRGFEGLQSPERRVGKINLSGQHGAFITNAFYGGRTLAISVQIFGSSIADFADRVNTFLAALDLDVSPATMTLTSAEGEEYSVHGVAQMVSNGPTFGERRYGTYTFEFFCNDYRILSSTMHSERIYLPLSEGGITIPTPIPLSFGSGSGGYAVVTNNGNTKSSPILVLTGPLTANISIRNVTTDQRFTYEADIANGQSITINTSNKTVVDQDGSNHLMYASNTYRDFIYLAPGDNEIYLSHSGAYNASGNLEVQWYDSYLGI